MLSGMVQMAAGMTRLVAVAVIKAVTAAEDAVELPEKDQETPVVGRVRRRSTMDEEMKKAAEEAAGEAMEEAALADALEEDAVEKAVEAAALEEAAEELMAEAVVEEAMAQELGEEAEADAEAAVVMQEVAEEDDA
jgi:transcription termination factor Rho